MYLWLTFVIWAHISLSFPDTEDASETDLAKHDEDDYVEIKEQWVFVSHGSAALTLMRINWVVKVFGVCSQLVFIPLQDVPRQTGFPEKTAAAVTGR